MADVRLHGIAHLMNLSRFEEAERRLHQLLLTDPQNGAAHALLSRCLLEQKKYAEATQEAETAVGLEPDASGAHFALARVWHERNYAERAMQSLEEAIRLAPDAADYHAYKAALCFEKSRWTEALAAAETALACDPEHVAANNFRAMSLVKLGRRSEAGQTIDAALARDPEDAFSHANKGWSLLEARRPKEAIAHFREALRLQPNMEYARLGIIEALKAQNPIYGFFLRYARAMAKLPPKWQIGVVVGAWFGNRLLGGLAKTLPALRPLITPIMIVYLVFALWTWLASPIFNLLLRLHPLGRHALSPEEKRETNWIGGCLVGALICLAMAFLSSDEDWMWGFLLPAMWLAGLTLPLHLVFKASSGWPRKTLIAATATMAVAAIGSLTMFLCGDGDTGLALSNVYFYLWLATIWGGQLVASATPRL